MNKNEKIKYLAYSRKSSEDKERQALSIDSQNERAAVTAKQNDVLEDVVEFLEESKSAFIPYNRSVFAKMIERIKNGEAQGIIVWHPDRLSRNEIDAATITYMLRTGELKNILFGSYFFNNSPEGIWQLQMALSQGQYESAKKGQDVKRGLAKKVQMGHPPYPAIAGYMNTPDREKGFKMWVEDPMRFPLIRKMWDMLLSQAYTPPQILKIANKEWGYTTPKKKNSGGKLLSRSGIYKIFNSPAYYAKYLYPIKSGNWNDGAYKPMITKEEFDRAQIILGRKGKPAPHTREHAFTGQIFCGECGCQITAEVKIQIICSNCKNKFACENKKICLKCETPIEKMVKPTLLNYYYYHCTKKRDGIKCSQHSIKADDLQKQINQHLATIRINQKYLDWGIEYLRKSHNQEVVSRAAVWQSQEQAYKKCSEKLDKLLEMRIAGELTEDEYKVKKNSLITDKEKYQALLKDTDNRQNSWLSSSEKALTLARGATEEFETACKNNDIQKQREILVTFGSNIILKDGKVSIQAPEPFFTVQKGLQEVPEAGERLEPKNNRIKKGKRGTSAPLNPHWLRRQDSNLEPSP